MWLGLLTALSVATAAPAFAAPAHYRLTLAGVRLGTLVLDATSAGDAYRASIEFETNGLAGLLDYGLEGSAAGRVLDGHTLVPALFTARSHSPRALRHTRIGWTDGVPSFVVVDPPREEAVDTDAATGALDPASALFRIGRPGPAGDVCGESLEVFDGSRIVRLDLGPPAKSAGGIACDGLYTRIGGEPLTPLDPPECPFRLLYRVAPDGTAVLERIGIPTRFGQALIGRAT